MRDEMRRPTKAASTCTYAYCCRVSGVPTTTYTSCTEHGMHYVMLANVRDEVFYCLESVKGWRWRFHDGCYYYSVHYPYISNPQA